MPNSPIIVALIAFSVLSCIFAFIRGAEPERIGAGVIFANLLLTLGGQAFIPEPETAFSVAQLTLDAVTALALLVLAVRYASLWLGAVMMLYALQFALHAFYSVTERPRDMLHAIVNNVDFFAVSLCLVIGTAASWRRRVRAASRPASA
jgi:hypothetical protein